MDRRTFLLGGLAAGAAGLTGAWRQQQSAITPTLRYPGLFAGHRLRDASALLPPPKEVIRSVDTLIVGSGAAGLSCAWSLQRAGFNDFVLMHGPAPWGNAAFGQHAFSAYPQGAHYLPVPAQSCPHVREILHDLGVLRDGLTDDEPDYDERYLVHAPAERVLHDGRWHAGLLPPLAEGSPAAGQWAQIVARFDAFKAETDRHGQHPFDLPRLLSSDTATVLDRQSFARWLTNQGVTDPQLRWYFDYCCRDEYGAPAEHISAWAGVHYFSSRRGRARHAESGAVLTWPQGLGFIAAGLQAKLTSAQQHAGTALAVRPAKTGYQVAVQTADGPVRWWAARQVVLATPLFVARRLAPDYFDDLRDAPGPTLSPWLVSSVMLNRFPREKPGAALSWDNVVHGSDSLGYIVATHQALRQALPEGTVFTAYHALGGADNRAQRAWLGQAAPKTLFALATRDLVAAYGNDWRQWCIGAEMTVHGHAMAVPVPGFLREPLACRARRALQDKQGLYFAHSDLSGYSVFEEASYWGVQAACAVLS